MAESYAYVEQLAGLLDTARVKKGWSFNRLGEYARVDPAQAFRICHGSFKRLNQSVLQICSALGVDPPGQHLPVHQADPSAEKMTRELMAAWDRTPEGANRLAHILRAMREYRSGG